VSTGESTDRLEAQAGGGHLASGLAAMGTLRWVVADLALPLDEVRRRLDLSPVSAVALGQALTGAVLLRRIALKVPARLTLTIDGDGPIGRIVAESESGGGVRGLVGDPQAETPSDGELRLAELVGEGHLSVSRETDGERYTSKVELVSGEIGLDLAHYLDQSEQIRSAVLVGVLPRPSGIAAAGGVIVEALPGTDDEVLEQLEENLRSLEGVSRTLETGGLGALQNAVLAGFDVEILEGRPLAYACGCEREQLRRQLMTLAQDDLESLFERDEFCDAVCAFCGESYRFSAKELMRSTQSGAEPLDRPLTT